MSERVLTPKRLEALIGVYKSLTVGEEIAAALLELRTLREENEKMRAALRTVTAALKEVNENVREDSPDMWDRVANALAISAEFTGEEPGT